MTVKRYGNFKISMTLIESHPDVVRKVMGKCIITRAEFVWASNCIEYTAISDLFEPIKDGMEIPNYNITINEDKEIKADLL